MHGLLRAVDTKTSSSSTQDLRGRHLLKLTFEGIEHEIPALSLLHGR